MMEKMESWNPERGLTENQKQQLKAELEKVQANQDSDEIEALELLAEAKNILENNDQTAINWWQKAEEKRNQFEKLKSKKEAQLKELFPDPVDSISPDADPEKLEAAEKLEEEIDQIENILEKLYGQHGDR